MTDADWIREAREWPYNASHEASKAFIIRLANALEQERVVRAQLQREQDIAISRALAAEADAKRWAYFIFLAARDYPQAERAEIRAKITAEIDQQIAIDDPEYKRQRAIDAALARPTATREPGE